MKVNKNIPENMSTRVKQISLNHFTHNGTQYEPHRDKTNKVNVRPAKTQIGLGMRLV